MADFIHRVDRRTGLAALAEIHFGHLSDDEIADLATIEIRRRDAPLQEVRIVRGPIDEATRTEIERVVLTVMRRN